MSAILKETNIFETFEEVRYHHKHGIPPGKSTGWPGFDKLFKFAYYGSLNVMTGYPGSGKSEWLDSLALYCSITYKWKVFIYSPQNFPASFHVEKLIQKVSGKPFFQKFNGREKPSLDDIAFIEKHLAEYWTFVESDKQRVSIEMIMNTLHVRLKTQKINMVIIDPWNVLQAKKAPGQKDTEFIGEWLPVIEDFAREHNIQFWLVSHPSKPGKTKGVLDVMTPYDIEDSRHWFDMSSNIFIANRTWDDKIGNDNKTDVQVAKVKDGRYGHCGEHTFEYQPWCGNYIDSWREG